MKLRHAAALALFLMLASTGVPQGQNTQEIPASAKAPTAVPAHKWGVIMAPEVFDREIGRLAIADYAPKSKWSFIAPDPTVETLDTVEACEGYRERLVKRTRDAFLDDSNSQNERMMREAEQGQCAESDGSPSFVPHTTSYTDIREAR
jgi:hypothetical protein